MIGQIRARKCNKMRSSSKARDVDFAPGPRISIPDSGHDRPRLKAGYMIAPDHATKRFQNHPADLNPTHSYFSALRPGNKLNDWGFMQLS
jgi:hypothetical protein